MKNVRKYLKIVLIGFICLITACNNSGSDDLKQKLTAPKNVYANKANMTLTWDKVVNCHGYQIGVFDKETGLINIIPTTVNTFLLSEIISFKGYYDYVENETKSNSYEIKIRAIANDSKYSISDWSLPAVPKDRIGLIFTIHYSGEFYSVTGSYEATTTIVIPETYLGKPVTNIAEKAFINHKNLKSVVIPGSVKFIGEKAFANCTQLIEVMIEDGVEKISENAFADCIRLEKVTIPSSVKAIDDYAFVRSGSVVVYVKDYMLAPAGWKEKWDYAQLHNDASLDIPIQVEVIWEGSKNINAYMKESTYIKIDNNILPYLPGYVSPQKFNNWLLNLDKVYRSYQEFTGHTPFQGEKILIVPNSFGELAWVDRGINKINLNIDSIQDEMRNIESGSWSETIMHEMAHIFHMDESKSPDWAFDYEFFAQLKIAYALETIPDAKIVESRDNTIYINDQYRKSAYSSATQLYQKNNTLLPFYDKLSSNFGRTGLDFYIYGIIDKAGWEPIKKAIHSYYNQGDYVLAKIKIDPVYSGSKTEEIVSFRKFLDRVEFYSIKDISLTLEDNGLLLEKLYPIIFEIIPSLKFNLINSGESYEVSVGNITLSEDTQIIIPSEYNNKPVTAIAANGFRDNYFLNDGARTNKITSILIPSSIKEIGGNAFYDCESLTSIIIPDSVIFVGRNILSGCVNLTSITTPFIGQSRTAKGSLSHLGYYFGGNKFEGALPTFQYFKDSDGENWHIVYYFPRDLETVIVTDTTTINTGTFYNCFITTVILPTNLKVIENHAFSDCDLTDLVIPEGVEYIGAFAFAACYNLTNINIPQSVNEIGEYAFKGCISLSSSITIPGNMEKIAEATFYNCTSLTSVTIEEGITLIEAYAFRYCSKLIEINIPSTVTTMHEGIFEECIELKTIYIPSSVKTMYFNLFNNCASLTIYVQGYTSQPSGWRRDWNVSNCPVVWGQE